MAGFGTSTYGGSSYGTSLPAFDVAAAWAQSAQAVRLQYTSAPRVSADRASMDGLTRGNYSLSVFATRTGMPAPPPPRILTIRAIDSRTVELLLAGELEGAGVTYEVTVADTVQNVGGGLIGLRRAQFLGLDSPRTLKGGLVAAEQKADALTDFGFRTAGPLGGGFRVAGGDLQLTEGEETLRKLVLRRLIFPRGSIAWRPDYGWNPGWHALIRSGSQAQRRAEAEQQVLQEPEVSSARISLRQFTGRGLVFVDADVKTRGGRGLDPISLPIQGGA